MSSKANHVKRSHRSNYKARMFSGSRQSVIKPSIKKNGFLQMIRKIRKFLNARGDANDS
ncbi:hypothetical protein [Treponema sp.]|uniref:hypothetical protein n=1 Tax=Treponema sp. TaxID=166 RepID=UPI003890393B